MKLQRAGWTFALAALACGGTDADTAASVRDSAGVEIVENPGDNRSLPQWRIRGAPVSIGVLDGEVAHQFDGLPSRSCRSLTDHSV